MIDRAQLAADQVKSRLPGFTPRLGIVLGSGLGDVADKIKVQAVIPYAEIPSFPLSRVAGHSGRMILGTLGGVPVVGLQGRIHLYEGSDLDDIRIFIRILMRLGCETVFITNASGSLRKDLTPGRFMAVSDHINLIAENPLRGPNDEAYGPRFPGLENAYDPDLRRMLHGSAKRIGLELEEGIYVACLGPSFETPAEIRAFAQMGGSAIGMSTAPETIVARHCGLKVVAVSVITNFGAGLGGGHSHDQTLAEAGRSIERLSSLIEAFLEDYAKVP
jgi:xanthosine phosphorylase